MEQEKIDADTCTKLMSIRGMSGVGACSCLSFIRGERIAFIYVVSL